MGKWVRLCSAAEVPQPGQAGQMQAAGVDICIANKDGRLSALDNWCPHRGGPLGEGWIEGNTVVCPWHAWGFDLTTGECPEERASVDVFPLKREGDDILIELDETRATLGPGAVRID